MKELEKIAPKKKGVVPQSVKEITQLLVDEGLVECEKIGTFVCYWAFPSQAAIIVHFFNSVFAPQQCKNFCHFPRDSGYDLFLS